MQYREFVSSVDESIIEFIDRKVDRCCFFSFLGQTYAGSHFSHSLVVMPLTMTSKMNERRREKKNEMEMYILASMSCVISQINQHRTP